MCYRKLRRYIQCARALDSAAEIDVRTARRVLIQSTVGEIRLCFVIVCCTNA